MCKAKGHVSAGALGLEGGLAALPTADSGLGGLPALPTADSGKGLKELGEIAVEDVSVGASDPGREASVVSTPLSTGPAHDSSDSVAIGDGAMSSGGNGFSRVSATRQGSYEHYIGIPRWSMLEAQDA
jgi:hypothetical protein